MLSHNSQTGPSVQERCLEYVSLWGWRSLKMVGGAIFILTVPGGLVLWLGREAYKRGAGSTGFGSLSQPIHWMSRKVSWTLNPLSKTTPLS